LTWLQMRVAHRAAVDAAPDVASLNPCGLIGSVFAAACDQRAARLVEPEALSDLVGDPLDTRPEPAAMHRVIFLALQFGDDSLGYRGRDREADTDRAAGG